MNASNTPARAYRPPAGWAWFYGLGTGGALALFVGMALRAWHTRGQGDFVFWLTGAALAAFAVPWLAYGWWWVRQVRYRLTAEALALHAPGAQAVLPLTDIVWAGVAAHYDRPLPPAPRHWPGLMVGLVADAQGRTVAFYGLQRARMVVVEDAEGRVFVLTPAAVAAFLEDLRGLLAVETGQATSSAPPAAAEPVPPAPTPAPSATASRFPRGAVGLVVLAWGLSLAGAVGLYTQAVSVPLGLQYAFYGHLVALGAETGAGQYLYAARRAAYAYALWAAGLLAALGFAWALFGPGVGG